MLSQSTHLFKNVHQFILTPKISHLKAPANYIAIPRINEKFYSTANLAESIPAPEFQSLSRTTEEHLKETTFKQHSTYGAPTIQSDKPIFRPTETDNKFSPPKENFEFKQPEKLPTFLELPYHIVPAIKSPEPKTPLFINLPEKTKHSQIQTIKAEDLPKDLQIPVNTQISYQDEKQQYTHGFSLDDGTKVTEQGKLISTDDGWEYVIAKKGQYEYISPDGTPIKVKWIADENGYRVL